VKNDDYIIPSVNYRDGLDRCILYCTCILFVFTLLLYCFCVATEFSVNKDLYYCGHLFYVEMLHSLLKKNVYQTLSWCAADIGAKTIT